MEQKINADKSDYVGPTLVCQCGQTSRYAGRRSKCFLSVLGSLNIERAYYHCAQCDTGFCPRDVALGLQGSTMSPAVTRMIGVVGAMVSFEESHILLSDLAGVVVSSKTVERVAESLGSEIAENERQSCESLRPLDDATTTLYLGMDGTGVPIRSNELIGRKGKQDDGSSKTREVKLVTIWSAEGRDKDGTPQRDEGSVTYSAAIESAATNIKGDEPSEFAKRVIREAQRRSFESVARRVIVGDGAVWIWALADEYFPDAIQILDRFHAKQHLSDVSKAIYGPKSDLAKAWATQRFDELDDGRIDDLLQALTIHAGSIDEARKCVGYVQANRARMAYPNFREQGLCTSSGVVEAGCKIVVGTRLKRCGMHWTVAGADAIIALRACQLSGRFEDFWEGRSLRALNTA